MMGARMRSALAFVLFVSHIVVAPTQFADANWISNGHDVKAFCTGQRVELSTTEDLKMLADHLDEAGNICPDHVGNALRTLREIVADRNACTMEKAQAITEFADKYLRNLNDGDDETGFSGDQSKQLPKSLIKFAIAYGMQVSSVCKKHMMNDFLFAANAILRKRFRGQFADFEHFVLSESSLSSVLQPITKVGEIILPSDLIQVVPGLEAKLSEYFSDELAVDLLRNLCDGTLRPLYEPVLLPLAQLVRAGFNTNDFSYSPKMRDHGRFWSFATFMCEFVKTIKMDADSSDEDEDETALQARPNLMPHQVKLGLKSELEPLKPYVPHEIVSSKILGRFDTSLKMLIKSYDANKSEAERLQDRIFKRSLRVFTMLCRKGDYKQFARKLLGGFKGDEPELEEARNGLIKLMDAPEQDSALFVTAKWAKKIAVKIGILSLVIMLAISYVFSLLLKQGPAKVIHRSLKDSLAKLLSSLAS